MKRLSIAIPASIVSDVPHLREKTSRIGLIGRTAAIFRVNDILVYPEKSMPSQAEDARLIATLLAYMETPQYLRKTLFKLSPILRYAGILPPLRTPHHPLNRKIRDLKMGEYREGVTVSREKEGSMIDIGVEQPVVAKNAQLAIGKRVTTKIINFGSRIEVELVDRDQVPTYWGYTVTVEKRSLGESLRHAKSDLNIATSKYGKPFSLVSREIAGKWAAANEILIAFGAPSAGLREVVARERLRLEELVDFIVNTIPLQGTETVRTEEALIASLACFNTAFSHEGSRGDRSRNDPDD